METTPEDKEKVRKREYDKLYRTKNIEKLKKEKKIYALKNKEYYKSYHAKYRTEHLDDIKNKKKIYRKNNAKHIRKKSKEFRENFPEYIKIYRIEYERNKRKIDPIFRLKQSMRRRLLAAIKNQNSSKSEKTFDLIGCSPEFLKNYLTDRFKDGMSWENHGIKGWHIDHIKPCASFNLSDLEERYKCFHYSNLQPLWWWENLKKSAKCIDNLKVGDNIVKYENHNQL